MRVRAWILPIAAVVIAALVAWKSTRTYVAPTLDGGRLPVWTPAPEFEETDQNNRRVRLKSYLGRHRALVAFFDGESGADRDPVLRHLKERFAELSSQDIKVFAIGRSRPVENRQAAERIGGIPFPLLSDVEGDGDDAILRWGRIVPETGAIRPGLFLIDRAGRVDWEGTAPRAANDPLALIDRLAAGE